MNYQIGSEGEVREWQDMIDRDVKKLQMREIYHRKNTHVRRFKSIDETEYKNSISGNSPTKLGQNNSNGGSKLKSNMSLLYVLTHKRSASDNHKTSHDYQFHPNKSRINTKMVGMSSMTRTANVSANVSRKSSIQGIGMSGNTKEHGRE